MPNASLLCLISHMPAQTPGISGYAQAMFALDVGFQIDLDKAQTFVQEATRLKVVRTRRPAPVWFDYSPPPIPLSMRLAGAAANMASHK